MFRSLFFIVLALFLFSACKNHSKSSKIPQSPSVQSDSGVHSIDSEKIKFFSKVDSTELKFNSLSAKGSLNFNQNGSEKSADINIRIKKDQIIWFYINYSIIPVAQGYITPGDIKIKNLISGEYLHKDFGYLNEVAGITINFQDLQSILVGNKLGSWIGDSTNLKVSSLGEFLLEGGRKPVLNRFSFNPQYRPIALDLLDSVHNKKLNLRYSNFSPQNGSFLPQSIRIFAQSDKNNLEIQMDYRKVQVNPDQEYPFNAPDESK